MGFLRRSLLFLPGDNPRFLTKALDGPADAVILDIEDAVAPHQKPAARLAVAEALRTADFGGKERLVRINALSTPYGREDVEAVVPARPHTLVVPKAEGIRGVQELDDLVTRVEKANGLPVGEVEFLLLIETPLGVINAESIALASHRVTGLSFGSGDYSLSTRCILTDEEWELLYPRTRTLLAARAAGVKAIDLVWPKVKDLEGLEKSARRARVLGYDGKALIHPDHIPVANRVFSPSPEDIGRARRIIAAVAQAEAEGKGAATLDGQLIETPHAVMAQGVLDIASRAGLL
ncbi:MAG: CoA ester lyase [Dehalococcoidia bacterium]|nr:CoA ester lyase [Dehalococcoidia bacterium]